MIIRVVGFVVWNMFWGRVFKYKMFYSVLLGFIVNVRFNKDKFL